MFCIGANIKFFILTYDAIMSLIVGCNMNVQCYQVIKSICTFDVVLMK